MPYFLPQYFMLSGLSPSSQNYVIILSQSSLQNLHLFPWCLTIPVLGLLWDQQDGKVEGSHVLSRGLRSPRSCVVYKHCGEARVSPAGQRPGTRRKLPRLEYSCLFCVREKPFCQHLYDYGYISEFSFHPPITLKKQNELEGFSGSHLTFAFSLLSYFP